MDEFDATNQGDAETSTGVETEVQDTEPTLDEQGDPIGDQAAPIEEEEEIELDDDLKLKLPKSQAEKARLALLRQADYTKKTQELAEQRKAFEAERQTVQQASEAELSARANLTLIDQNIAKFEQVDWNTWFEQDPFEANKASHQFQMLKDAREKTNAYLGTVQQERTERQQQETAKRLQEGAAELAKAIPDWSPERAAKLMDHGQQAYGFSKEDLDGIDDPRLVRVLDAAYRWHEHQATQKKVQAVEKLQAVEPAAKASRSAAPKPGLDDRLSAAEWIARREAQVRKRQA